MTKTPIKHQKIFKNLSSMDEEVWDYVAASVKPLRSSLKNRVTERKNKTIPQDVCVQKSLFEKSNFVPAGVMRQHFSLPELSHGTQAGLDKNNAKRLKKGKHPIERRLDLHGMTQTQAHAALSYFIETSYQAGKRCVLIITGKGSKSMGSVGVLRLAVPRWLNEELNRIRVLAFSYATPKDGGEGALYVMLKKKR